MARIAIGGFQHETNTFAAMPARYEDFARADGWPALLRGREMLDVLDGINLPAAGFIAAAKGRGHDLRPCSGARPRPPAR